MRLKGTEANGTVDRLACLIFSSTNGTMLDTEQTEVQILLIVLHRPAPSLAVSVSDTKRNTNETVRKWSSTRRDKPIDRE